MNTHDIELPPLPKPAILGTSHSGDLFRGYVAMHMQNYARAAIEADRQRRGEPVAWRWKWKDAPDQEWHLTNTMDWQKNSECTYQPLYIERIAPQPDDFSAQLNRIDESMKAGARLTKHRFRLDAPQPAEPVKGYVDIDDVIAESIARGEMTKEGLLEARQWVRDTYYNPAESVKVPSDRDILDVWKACHEFQPDGLSAVLALLERYGQREPVIRKSQKTANGDDSSKQITINGGDQRDITIHAAKDRDAAKGEA